MKNFLAAIALCSAVLLLVSFVVVRSASAGADDDVISALLMLPAPPAPNPLQKPTAVVNERPEEFYSADEPPPDNGPIEDILDYWSKQRYQTIDYNNTPSPVVLDRIAAAMEIDSTRIVSFLNYLKDSPRGISAVRSAYNRAPDREAPNSNLATYDGGYDVDYNNTKSNLKNWLIMNDPDFSAELEKMTDSVKDTENGYVSNQEQLLALAKNDWDRARPAIDKMYADTSQPASKTLATWALYKKAMDDGSISDTEKYRGELTATIKNRDLSDGIRDLAMDAVVHSKEWSGRDDWYFSMMEDESLLKLGSYTGLTTIIRKAPAGKYTEKMIKMVRSSNPTLRAAAARNLAVDAGKGNRDAIAALLPWLENPNWVKDVDNTRSALVRALGQIKLPESVPGLVAIMNERVENKDYDDESSRYSNMTSNAVTSMRSANIAANGANVASNSYAASYTGPKYSYPYRYGAIVALTKQASPVAVPALRRLYFSNGENDPDYYGRQIVAAIYASGGFSIPEQVDSLESVTRSALLINEKLQGLISNRASVQGEDEDESEYISNEVAKAYSSVQQASMTKEKSRNEQMTEALGTMVASENDPSDILVAATIQKINSLEAREPTVASILRLMVSGWNSRAAFAMQLADLKNGKAPMELVVKLLGERKKLRENQPTDVYEARNGVPMAAGIATCILEDSPSYGAILNGQNTEVKAAFLACSRLIRIPLPVQMVAANLDSPDKRLAEASELYLESEDSPEARSIIFGRFPGQAKIVGSRISFKNENSKIRTSTTALFPSVDGRFGATTYSMNFFNASEFEKSDKRFRAEVLTNNDLVGVYVYGKNILRIYADRVTYDSEENDSRSYQRVLSQQEFESLKNYLAKNNVSEMKAFLGCSGGCEGEELLMLGKAGGSRVFSYMDSDEKPEFFKGLDEYFETLQKTPGQLHYEAADKLPGFEVLFADPRLKVGTVWADGDDIRFLATDVAAREAIDKQIQEETQTYYSTFDEESDVEPDYSYSETLSAKREFDASAWYKFSPQGITSQAVQPQEVEAIPLKTNRAIEVFEEPWKSRGGGVELRTDEKALYKVSGGREVKIADGNFFDAVVSADGRWALARTFDEEYDQKLVRIDLSTGRSFPVVSENWLSPIVWVPALNKFLVGTQFDYGEEYGSHAPPQNLTWIDPATGTLAKAGGLLEPLIQQTFRQLQRASTGGYWTAIPDTKKNETKVGVYDPATQKFTAKLTVPSIQFDSMEMWADEKRAVIYIVYDGHLLRVPIGKIETRP